MDTYWIEGTEDKEGASRLCLRPHLTGASVRYLKKHGVPARFVYPGGVYRNETTDARHERAFFQYEALIVDKDIFIFIGNGYDSNYFGKSVWKEDQYENA